MLPADVPAAPITHNTTIFLSGPAGAGKTTLARRRLRHLLREGVPADSILVLVPQRTLGLPYELMDTGTSALSTGDEDPAAARDPLWAPVDVVTLGGLARRAIDLFWPLVSKAAGFAQPLDPPTFLTLETAQYYMSRQAESARYYGGEFHNLRVAAPRHHMGRHAESAQHDDETKDLRISAPRLASQVLDNLNKAALVGFPVNEIANRLKEAWMGTSSQAKVYDFAQSVALAFRDYCLAHNLLDFSLQIDLFRQHLLPLSEVRSFLFERYRHVIADNVEEDTPVAHDLLREWLSQCHSALVILDQDAGYRVFLGADPEDALTLAGACRHQVSMSLPAPWQDEVAQGVQAFGIRLAAAVGPPGSSTSARAVAGKLEPRRWRLEERRFFPEMVDWAADEISRLVTIQGVSPSEIVVLAPFLTDALRFALTTALDRYGIPVRSHRPSRSLREEPAARCLLTLAALGHSEWRVCPAAYDVAYALSQALEGLDLVRAHLLAQAVFQLQEGQPFLSSFSEVGPDIQERITFVQGSSYDRLHDWLSESRGKPWSLDVYLTLLFDQVLSRAGFGFRGDMDAAAVAARLIESVRKFRQAVPESAVPPERTAGQEYLLSVEQGILAATSLLGARQQANGQAKPAVFLAPAYTFLLSNQPVDYQFWLNVGSASWWERIYQPLTQPYVLSRRPLKPVPGAELGPALGQETGEPVKWTETHETAARQDSLRRQVLGLSRRCRRGIYLGIVDLDESGNEGRGPLLKALQKMLRQIGPGV